MCTKILVVQFLALWHENALLCREEEKNEERSVDILPQDAISDQFK